MRKLFRSSLLTLAGGLVVTACGGSSTPTTPTTFATIGDRASFSVTPSSVIAQPVFDARCPSVPPFDVPFSVIVRANSGVNVFVTEVRLHFVDSFGVPMPQVTLPAPVLTTQFGTLLVEARGSRTFPMSVPLGCVTARSGTLFVSVDTRDGQGRMQTGAVSVAVR
jgi:hypothetical protein